VDSIFIEMLVFGVVFAVSTLIALVIDPFECDDDLKLWVHSLLIMSSDVTTRFECGHL
jgi:hypothetical protein